MKSHMMILLAVAGQFVPMTSFGDAMVKPLLQLSGDFDGDGQYDRVQGFPAANGFEGRVDVSWGASSFRAAWPTILSADNVPGTQMVSGRLGEALAVGDFDGDQVDDLAIGAPTTNASAVTNCGSVVVIYGCASCGSVAGNGAGLPAVGSALDPSAAAGAQRIFASTKVAYGRFGKSLASGDFDGDGFDDLAVGSPGDTVNNHLEAGSVTIFYGSASGLDLATRQRIHQDLLPAGASPAEDFDHFGHAVGAAKLDGDAYDDLVAGVPDEDYGVLVDPGEVDLFWGGSNRLSAANYSSFRHSGAMVGGSTGSDRLGLDLVAFDLFGILHLQLSEAATCGGKAFLGLTASQIGAANPAVTLNCESNICDPGVGTGDGALGPVPVHFIVIANSATAGANQILSTVDPISGEPISSTQYFDSMIDLLNQQFRGDDGRPICTGMDCLRFAYGSHHSFATSMFDAVQPSCDKLHALSQPAADRLGEDRRAFTENCNSSTCPQTAPGSGARYSTFSNFLQAAIEECDLVTAEEALTMVIYDNCERTVGADAILNTGDDGTTCTPATGHGRYIIGRPYAFVDYARALLPRSASSSAVAAEEHEVGHALGLHHACDATAINHVMQGAAECVQATNRTLGFATTSRTDVYGNSIVERDQLLVGAIANLWVWECL